MTTIQISVTLNAVAATVPPCPRWCRSCVNGPDMDAGTVIHRWVIGTISVVEGSFRRALTVSVEQQDSLHDGPSAPVMVVDTSDAVELGSADVDQLTALIAQARRVVAGWHTQHPAVSR